MSDEPAAEGISYTILLHTPDGPFRVLRRSDIPAKIDAHLARAIELALDAEELDAAVPEAPVAAAPAATVLQMGLTDEQKSDLHFLDCLRAAGVDSWEGYDIATELANAEAEVDDSDPEEAEA